MTKEQLEELWRAQIPSCLTCGWSPAFYEVSESIGRESDGVWWAPCVSKDADDSFSHRGYWLYEKKETEMTNEEFIDYCRPFLPSRHFEHAKKLVAAYDVAKLIQPVECDMFGHNKLTFHKYDQDCPYVKQFNDAFDALERE